jgi:AcrR family transcriptional regulator
VEEPADNLTLPSARAQPHDILATNQRERILEATIELVAKRGYRGTSIDHIVKRARVGYAAFYELFEGKEQCFCTAFEVVVEDARQRIATSVSLSAPWSEQVCTALASLLELIAAEPFRARIVFTEAHTAGEAALRRHEALLDRVALLLREGRALCPGASELPLALEKATADGIVWLLNQRVVIGKVENLDQLFPELAQIVLEPYLGKVQARALIATRSGARAPA